MLFCISYDLNKPGQNYPELYDKIKKLASNWCHPVDSTWFIETSYSASEVRDSIVSVIDSSDSIIVVKASAPGAWVGLSSEASQWLKNHLL
jgi:hypothetical protein